MVFSSHIFLFYFLPLTLLLYYSVPRLWRMPALTVCSYVFYGWTNPWFCVLLAWSTTVDFICGNFIAGLGACPASRRTRPRRADSSVPRVSNAGCSWPSR